MREGRGDKSKRSQGGHGPGTTPYLLRGQDMGINLNYLIND